MSLTEQRLADTSEPATADIGALLSFPLQLPPPAGGGRRKRRIRLAERAALLGLLAAVALLVCLTWLPAAPVPVDPSPGCAVGPAARGAGGGPELLHFLHGGRNRTYWLVLPNRTFSAARPAPLLLSFHG